MRVSTAFGYLTVQFTQRIAIASASETAAAARGDRRNRKVRLCCLLLLLYVLLLLQNTARQRMEGMEKIVQNIKKTVNKRNNYTNNSIAADAAVAAGSKYATQLTLNWQQQQQLSLSCAPTPFLSAIMQKNIFYMHAFLSKRVCICVCVQNFNPNIL